LNKQLSRLTTAWDTRKGIRPTDTALKPWHYFPTSKPHQIMLLYFCRTSQRHYLSCEGYTTNISENAKTAKAFSGVLGVPEESMHMSKFDGNAVFWSDAKNQRTVEGARIIQNAIKQFEQQNPPLSGGIKTYGHEHER